MIRVGTAGWSLPGALAGEFPREGSHLERYATRFDAVEINSSFYRSHRRSTYERWAASVPEGFRFSVKLPKAITHELRFLGCDDLVARFAEETAGLGEKRGPILVQLPPSFAYPAELAASFFAMLRGALGTVVCEPRHASWFEPDADEMLERQQVARVASDPATAPPAAFPGGSRDLAYFRLHGSPAIYRSSYDDAAIAHHAEIARSVPEAWVIYDNTTFGAATDNALQLRRRAVD